jgi:hypothetical protein
MAVMSRTPGTGRRTGPGGYSSRAVWDASAATGVVRRFAVARLDEAPATPAQLVGVEGGDGSMEAISASGRGEAPLRYHPVTPV